MNSQTIDKTLTDIFKKLQESEYQIRYDSIAPLFKQQVIKYLSSPLTLDNKLENLETLITIVQSPDKKIKFYSWDELTGEHGTRSMSLHNLKVPQTRLSVNK
jgi:hypothetical protein